MVLALIFVFFALMWLSVVVGEGLDSIANPLNQISESLDILANHLEHSCDKCKAEAEGSEEETNN